MAEKTNFVEKIKSVVNKLPFNNLAGKVPALAKVAGYANYAFCALVVVVVVAVALPKSSKVPPYLVVEGTEVIRYIPNGVPSKIKIPNGITVIGESAFEGFKTLESISFPNTLTEIGKNAFANCTSLKTVNIPKRCEKIGNNAFSGCIALEKLTLSEGVKQIWIKSFYACKSLTKVTIPRSMELIGQNAFQNCTSLKSITFADTGAVWYQKWVGGGSNDEFGALNNSEENARKLTAYNLWALFKSKNKRLDGSK